MHCNIHRYSLSLFLILCLNLRGQDVELEARTMAAMKPGPEHQFFDKYVGHWDLDVQIWMSPDALPMHFKGTGEGESVLGGRFLQFRSTSGAPPMVIEAMQMYGYDRRHERFTLVGFDSSGTYYLTAAGALDEGGRVLTLEGENQDPIKRQSQAYAFITTWTGEDQFVTELIFKGEADKEKGFKAAEIKGQRMDR